MVKNLLSLFRFRVLLILFFTLLFFTSCAEEDINNLYFETSSNNIHATFEKNTISIHFSKNITAGEEFSISYKQDAAFLILGNEDDLLHNYMSLLFTHGFPIIFNENTNIGLVCAPKNSPSPNLENPEEEVILFNSIPCIVLQIKDVLGLRFSENLNLPSEIKTKVLAPVTNLKLTAINFKKLENIEEDFLKQLTVEKFAIFLEKYPSEEYYLNFSF